MSHDDTRTFRYDDVSRELGSRLAPAYCSDGFPLFEEDALSPLHARIEAFMEGTLEPGELLESQTEELLRASAVRLAWVSEEVFGRRDGRIAKLSGLVDRCLRASHEATEDLREWVLDALARAGRARRDAVPWAATLRWVEEGIARDGLGEATADALAGALMAKGWDTEVVEHTLLVARAERALMGLHERVFQRGEAWSDEAWSTLGRMEDGEREAWTRALVRMSTSKPKPSKRWLSGLEKDLEGLDEAQIATHLTRWFSLVGARPDTLPESIGASSALATLVSERNEEILRGMVWACIPMMNDALAQALGDLALTCYRKIAKVGPRAPKLGNACIRALGEVDSEATASQLWRLKLQLDYKTARTQVSRALDRMSERMEIEPRELEELFVPDFGLDASGVARREIGGWQVTMKVGERGKVAVSWSRAGAKQLTLLDAPVEVKEQKSAPKHVRQNHAEEFAAFELELKELEAMLSTQRDRLELLLHSPRRWSFDKWTARYACHPLVGLVASRLVWEVERADGRRLSAMWDRARSALVDAHGARIEDVDAWATVGMWHPARASADEVSTWRARLRSARVTQPFRQIYREVCEMASSAAANEEALRIDGVVVRQHQFAALCKSRHWDYRLQGSWGFDSRATKSFEEHELEVWLTLEPIAHADLATGAGVFTYARTRSLHVERRGARVDPAALDAGLRSEILRDLDMFFVVAGVTPASAPAPLAEWCEEMDVELSSRTSATFRARLSALSDALAVNGSGASVSTDQNHLDVQGTVCGYRLDLRNAAITMLPGGQPVELSMARAASTYWCPHHDDQILHQLLARSSALERDDELVRQGALSRRSS